MGDRRLKMGDRRLKMEDGPRDPGGTTENSPAFQRWVVRQRACSPAGRLRFILLLVLQPFGTCVPGDYGPRKHGSRTAFGCGTDGFGVRGQAKRDPALDRCRGKRAAGRWEMGPRNTPNTRKMKL